MVCKYVADVKHSLAGISDYYWDHIYVYYTFVILVHGEVDEVFVQVFIHIRRPLILKYWTNELNELHEVLHANECERMK